METNETDGSEMKSNETMDQKLEQMKRKEKNEKKSIFHLFELLLL